MAKVYDEWINKITKLREDMRQYDQVAATMRREDTVQEDAILSELIYIKERINASSRILTDKARTAFFFVVVPEEMIILDTKKAAELFAKFDVPLDVPGEGHVEFLEMIILDTKKAAELFAKFDVPLSGYIVNRVLPPDLGAGTIPP